MKLKSLSLSQPYLSNKRKLWSTVVFLMFVIMMNAGICAGSTYYSDYCDPGADDSGPGTMEQPWRHCPGMPGWEGTIQLNGGDVVYFCNSSVWEVSEGDSGIQITGGVTYDGKSWGSGSRATLRAMDELSRAVINVMEDHPTEETVIRGFEVDAGNKATSGITMNWPHMQRDLTGAMKRVEDCVVHDVSSRSNLNQYEYGILIGGWFGYRTSNVEILDCLVYDVSRVGIACYPGNDVPENHVENVVIRGCEVYNAGLDPDSPGAGFGIALKNHVANAVVEYNYLHQAKVSGIVLTCHPEPGFRGPENAVIRHNIVHNCRQWGIYLEKSGDKSAAIYGNLIFHNAYEGILLASSLSDGLSLSIFNNTLYHNYQLDWSQEVRISSSNAEIDYLDFSNNLIYASGMTRCLLDDDNEITSHSNNLYYREHGAALVVVGDEGYTADTIAEWEPTALTGNPKLVDVTSLPSGFSGVYGVDLEPNAEGLNIAPLSSALDYGIPLGESYNTSINSIQRPAGDGWDLGAYERSAAPTPEPTATPAEFSPTPSPPPLGVRIILSTEYVRPGELFYVWAYLDNPGPSMLTDIPLFFMLGVYGEYWFWPSWSAGESPEQEGMDFQYRDIPPGSTFVNVLPAFAWPDTGTLEMTGLIFYGAMLDQSFAFVLGQPAIQVWGFGP